MRVDEVEALNRRPVATKRFEKAYDHYARGYPAVAATLADFIEFRRTHGWQDRWSIKDSPLTGNYMPRNTWHAHLEHGKVIVIYQMSNDLLKLIDIVEHNDVEGGSKSSDALAKWIDKLTDASFEPWSPPTSKTLPDETLTPDEIGEVEKLIWELAAHPDSIKKVAAGDFSEWLELCRMAIEQDWPDATKDRLAIEAMGGVEAIKALARKAMAQMGVREAEELDEAEALLDQVRVTQYEQPHYDEAKDQLGTVPAYFFEFPLTGKTRRSPDEEPGENAPAVVEVYARVEGDGTVLKIVDIQTAKAEQHAERFRTTSTHGSYKWGVTVPPPAVKAMLGFVLKRVKRDNPGVVTVVGERITGARVKDKKRSSDDLAGQKGFMRVREAETPGKPQIEPWVRDLRNVRVLAKDLNVDFEVVAGRKGYSLLWIDAFRANANAGAGQGAKVVQALCDLADEYGKDVRLAVWENEKKLVDYYKRFGFHLTGDTWHGEWEMLRKPKGGPTPVEEDVFHGSPHKFDRFSTEHIGKGEGAQMFGWGLYFSGAKEVAQHYANTLGKRDIARPDDMSTKLRDLSYQDLNAAIEKANEIATARNRTGFSYQYFLPDGSMIEFDRYEEVGKAYGKTSGALYTASIPDEDHYLLWDAPLSQQPAPVQAALAKIDHPVVNAWRENGAWDHATGQNLYKSLAGGTSRRDVDTMKATSLTLDKLGIAGIKYLDGFSRHRGDGSYNYVLFNDQKVAMKEGYYDREEDDPMVAKFRANPHVASYDEKDPVVTKYMEGLCFALALALHKRYGWPIYGLGGSDEDLAEYGEDTGFFHAYVRHPSGVFIDVTGPHSAAAIEEVMGEPLAAIDEAFLMRWFQPEKRAEVVADLPEANKIIDTRLIPNYPRLFKASGV